MTDITEPIRRHAINVINSEVESNDPEIERSRLEKKHGKVWSTEELTENFEIKGFLAPFIMVRSKKTGKDGVLEFQHLPRFYFNYTEA